MDHTDHAAPAHYCDTPHSGAPLHLTVQEHLSELGAAVQKRTQQQWKQSGLNLQHSDPGFTHSSQVSAAFAGLDSPLKPGTPSTQSAAAWHHHRALPQATVEKHGAAQTYLNNLRSRSLSPSQVFPDVPTGSLSRTLAPGLGDPMEEHPMKASPSMQLQAQQLQHQQQQVGGLLVRDEAAQRPAPGGSGKHLGTGCVLPE